MQVKLKVEKTFEAKILTVKAGARYWEDSEVNGVADEEGKLIPFRKDDYWCPDIDIDSGVIIGWPVGTTASLHYKVCDDGTYYIKDSEGVVILTKNYYVPRTMCPKENGHGDYIIMDIDENGKIADWKFDIEDFIDSED